MASRHVLWLPAVLAVGCADAAPWRYNYLRNDFFAVRGNSTVLVDKYRRGGAFVSVQTGARSIIVYGLKFYDRNRERMTPAEATYGSLGDRLEVQDRFDGG